MTVITEIPAMKSGDALGALVGPTDREAFYKDYWGSAFLVSRGTRARHADLFSWDALEHILSTQRFSFPRLRLFKGGRVIAPANYIERRADRRGMSFDVHNSSAVERLLSEGALLHITSIGETWPPLARFAAALENDLCARVQVNLHAGLSAAKGFHTHWDGHDVYAIQIAGKKQWRLFGFTEEAPLAVRPELKGEGPAHHTWEGILGIGDTLYLPRGYWHSTQYVDSASLHLTFAVEHPTGKDLAEWLVSQMGTQALFRRDVPLPFLDVSDAGDSAARKYLTMLSDALGATITLASFSEFLNQYRTGLGHLNHIAIPTERTATDDT